MDVDVYSECVELVLVRADGFIKPLSFVNVLNREELYCETLSLTTLNPDNHDGRIVPSFSV